MVRTHPCTVTDEPTPSRPVSKIRFIFSRCSLAHKSAEEDVERQRANVYLVPENIARRMSGETSLIPLHFIMTGMCEDVRAVEKYGKEIRDKVTSR